MAILVRPSQPTVITPSSGGVTVIRPVSSSVTVIRPAQSAVSILPSLPVTVMPVSRSAIAVAPSTIDVVEPPARGAWDDKGWTRSFDGGREIYEGYYRAGARQFMGWIESSRNGRRIKAYIYDPPAEIRNHRHGACFQQTGIGTAWFLVHWQTAPSNVDDAILYIEQVLNESMDR